jgi:hypothetical protein
VAKRKEVGLAFNFTIIIHNPIKHGSKIKTVANLTATAYGD